MNDCTVLSREDEPFLEHVRLVCNEHRGGVGCRNQDAPPAHLASNIRQVLHGLLRRDIVEIPDKLAPAISGGESRGASRIYVEYRYPQPTEAAGEREAGMMPRGHDHDRS